MAKPKRRKKQAFSIQAYDNAHYKATDAYVAIIERLFDRCTDIIAAASANGTYDTEKPFSFADHPQLRSVMVKATNQLADNMTATIVSGTRKQWEFANKKCDAFIASIMDTSKLTKRQMEQMQIRSLEGLGAFQARKVGGMNLSQRVWKYVEQYKEQMEHALDVGLGEGRDYRQLARDLKTNLREPDRLFRRVRNKRGNLQLSRNAAAYHPGTGVYRSSVKNAQRLARSEINMAYREADWERWQSLDFVVGFEVVRSNWRDDKGHEYKCKLCERLKGRYPKSFKFVGWHPQCRCHAVPIMADYFSEDASNDRIARMRAALYGTEYKKYVPKETITDLPDGFKDWMNETIAKQEAGELNWSNPPYFVRDNFRNGNLANGLLNEPRKLPAEPPRMKLSALPDDQRKTITERIQDLPFLDLQLRTACKLYGIDTTRFDTITQQIQADPERNWQMLDDADVERKRLESECDRRAAMDKQTATDIAQNFEKALLEAAKWIDMTKPMAERKKLSMAMMVAKNARWGDYSAIINSTVYRDAYANEIMLAKADWDDMKREANNLITAMNDATKTGKLATLAAEMPTRQRPAYKIADDILKEIERLKATLSNGKPMDDIYKKLDGGGVKQETVDTMAKPMTDTEAITKVAGGDKTKGSCASAALAYVGNRKGFDVLDFRGGDSCRMLSRNSTLDAIAEAAGGTVISKVNDFTAASELMGMMKEGREYYFGVGQHVAIVRKTSTGYEYLELQSSISNGFKPLTTERLKNRFGCKRSHSSHGVKYEISAELIDIESLMSHSGFRKLLSYINTASDKQQRGVGGTTK